MSDNDAYTLFAAAAMLGLMQEGNSRNAEETVEYADYHARLMVAAQKKFDKEQNNVS